MNCRDCGVELVGGFTNDICLRCKGMQVKGGPVGRNSDRYVPSAVANPAWERGVAGETRADGSFVPYLSVEGQGAHAMGVKEYAENRHKFEAIRDRQRKDPNVFADLKR
jgi:hypothetical protein